MSENENVQSGGENNTDEPYRGPWGYMVRGMWRSPLGIFGVALTTISITLMLVGLIVDQLGIIHNPYIGVITFMILPGGMVTGLIIIPVAAYLRRRQFYQFGVSRDHLHINLSDHRHRKYLIGFIALTVVNVCILAIIAYEGYHFTDSPYFCGVVCHQVMEPEYERYKRSPHVRVACVECHIGSGAQWFVKAKISGLRQVLAVMTDSFSRPIPAPVTHLRPARDICEECHWPEKFHGKKVKIFTHFTNNDQVNPVVNEMALHIGGRNPQTDAFEGIHWHVSQDVKVSYLAVDDKRTKIAKVQVVRPDGSQDEFVKSDIEVPEGVELEWRVMDCVDCHNRPTHVYDMPEERVDFGLLSKAINPDIQGIREDSLRAITREYSSREEAKENMIKHLLGLQRLRGEEQFAQFEKDIEKAGEYLLETYLANVWPEMNITWGTYLNHLGHQYEDQGFGCFRCHDEEHTSEKTGETITQDCSLCHDEPE